MDKMFSSLAFVTVIGATPITIFVGTLADAATPIRANSTSATLYLSTGLAAALGFQKDMHVPAVDVGLADIDPRLIKSGDIAYAVVDRKSALEMIENMKGQVGRADKDTVIVDDAGYAVMMLDAETMRSEPQYAELVDDEITDDSVLILVIGPAAAQVLRGLDIDPDKIVIGDDAVDIFDTFRQYTLGLGGTAAGDMPGTDSTLGAKPALADA